MTFQRYIERTFSPENTRLIVDMQAICEDYVAQGYRLTTRQLYYQLVARAMVENTLQSYKRIAGLVSDARLAGLMDWEAIEDRTREVSTRTRWGSGSEIVQASADSFHMDMWVNQPVRLFVVVEKEALSGVLEGVCHRLDIPLLAARGYPSVSVVRDIVMSHFWPAVNQEQGCIVVHLGDHDPSGIDMTRDLKDRIALFMEDEAETVSVMRVALNMAQIEALNPPENPAKTTDSRFASYRKRFGTSSWELDALEPRYLVNLVERVFDKAVDANAWAERSAEVEDIRLRLSDAASRFADEEGA